MTPPAVITVLVSLGLVLAGVFLHKEVPLTFYLMGAGYVVLLAGVLLRKI